MNIGYYHTPTETLCNEEVVSTYIQSTDFTLRAETQRTCLINPWGWQQMCIYVYTTVSLYCFVMYIFCWWHENKPLLTYLLIDMRVWGSRNHDSEAWLLTCTPEIISTRMKSFSRGGNIFHKEEIVSAGKMISAREKKFPRGGNHFLEEEIFSMRKKTFPPGRKRFREEIFSAYDI